jgi:hypothetical protein
MSLLGFPLALPLGGDAEAATEAVVLIDHVRTALGRLPMQWRSAAPMEEPELRTNVEKYLAVLIAPFNDIELALQQLIQLRDIYTATGIYLDSIGELVGQLRNGLGDSDYRRHLFARIRTNRSNGRRKDLIAIAKLILNEATSRVVVETVGPASVTVRIEGVTVPDALASILITFLAEAAAAGVRLLLESSPEPLADQFACPLAAFATAGAYTAGQTTITVDSTSGFPVIGTLIIDEGLAAEETVEYAGTTATTFTLLDPLVNAHTIRAAVVLDEPSTGQGFGDEAEGENLVAYSDIGSTGGTLIDVREAA